MKLCFRFAVIGIGEAPRGPYQFCLSEQKEFPCPSKWEKGSLWPERLECFGVYLLLLVGIPLASFRLPNFSLDV